MKFNINDYKDKKVVMHCKTLMEAIDFFEHLDGLGIKWFSHGVSNRMYCWDFHKTETCYNFNDILMADKKFYIENDYTILEWSDFMEKKEFTKSDLKTGDVVLRRNNDVEIVCLETGSLIGKDGYNLLSKINEDLTSTLTNCGDHDWDIIAVRRPKRSVDCQFSAFEYKFGELVYEEEEPEEMTLEEICKTLGKKIKIVG